MPTPAPTPSVPAEQGGKGFTGEGWETNTDFDLIGDPRAVKGGVLQRIRPRLPRHAAHGRARVELGPELHDRGRWSTSRCSTIHPTTLDYIPVLATHWQISAGQAAPTAIRINPNARWADGQPVTADDVVASWKFKMDKGLQDPSYAADVRQVREAGRREQVHRLGEEQGAQLAQLPLLLGHVDLPRARAEDGRRRRLPQATTTSSCCPAPAPTRSKRPTSRRARASSIRRRTDYWAEKYRRNVGVEQLRRDSRSRRARSEARLRDVQEGRPRRLLRQHLARVGRGAELRPRPARPASRSARSSTTRRAAFRASPSTRARRRSTTSACARRCAADEPRRSSSSGCSSTSTCR